MKERLIRIQTTDRGNPWGLRAESRNPRNNIQMVNLKNARVTESGLSSFTDMDEIPSLASTWPYPQLFETSTGVYAAQATALYILDDSDWSASLLVGGLTPGYNWSCADFHTYQVFANGSGLVTKNPVTASYIQYSASDIPTCNSVCAFHGRLWCGGLSDWLGLGSNAVAWSSIGHVSCQPTEVITDLGNLTTRENLAGAAPMPFEGSVWMVKPLGGVVMVYGDHGIAALRPRSGPQYGEGAVELIPLATWGIAARQAVAGGDRFHVLVSADGTVWRASLDQRGEPQLERLGYQEFFSSWLTDTIVLSWDSHDQDVYLSNGTECYLLSPWGLGACHQIPYGCLFHDTLLVGVCDDTAEDDFQLTTDIIDMGSRGLKTLYAIEVGTDTPDTVEVAVDWRRNKAGVWSRTGWVKTNQEGHATIVISGAEFRILVRAESYTGLDVDYVNLRYKDTDQRFKRGS